MSDVLRHVAHRFSRQIRVGGRLCLTANDDPALVAVYAALGWSDPHPIEPDASVLEAATVEAPERAVMPGPKGRRG